MRWMTVTLLFAGCAGAAVPLTYEEYVAMGDKCAAEGDRTGAYNRYSGAIALNPDRAEGRSRRAAVCLAAERWGEALEDADVGLKARPWDAQLHRCRGQSLMGLGRFEDAAVAFGRACERDPASAPSWHDLAMAHYQAKKLDRAIEAIERALQIAPETPYYRDLLADFNEQKAKQGK